MPKQSTHARGFSGVFLKVFDMNPISTHLGLPETLGSIPLQPEV
jgi:hypothetical protein